MAISFYLSWDFFCSFLCTFDFCYIFFASIRTSMSFLPAKKPTDPRFVPTWSNNVFSLLLLSWYKSNQKIKAQQNSLRVSGFAGQKVLVPTKSGKLAHDFYQSIYLIAHTDSSPISCDPSCVGIFIKVFIRCAAAWKRLSANSRMAE